MSTDQTAAYVPEWTQGDRLRKARSLTGMTVREFAEHIGVSHGTITSAETDARAVRPITLKAWALATGVSQEWLQAGASAPTPPRPPGGGLDNEAVAKLAAQKRARTGPTRDNRRYDADAA